MAHGTSNINAVHNNYYNDMYILWLLQFIHHFMLASLLMRPYFILLYLVISGGEMPVWREGGGTHGAPPVYLSMHGMHASATTYIIVLRGVIIIAV